MRAHRLFPIGLASVLAFAAFEMPKTANAHVSGAAPDGPTAGEHVQPSRRLADVVVNGSSQAPAAPAPAAPAPVVVQAPAAQSPAPAPVTQRSTVVTHEDHNYMSTIAVSALMGAVAGALVGGSIYFLADDRQHANRIGYWAAGGVLVGTGVGLTQVLVQEGRADRAVSSLPSDPAPTFRVALLQGHF